MSLLKNTTWGFLGELAVRFSKIAQVALFTRLLGLEQYGRFTYAFSVACLAAVFFDFGISVVATREIAKKPGDRSVVFQYLNLKLLTSIVGYVMLVIWAWSALPDRSQAKLVLLLGLQLWLMDTGTYVFVIYRCRREFWKETMVRGITVVIQLVLSAIVVVMYRDVEKAALALVIVAAASVGPLIFELRHELGSFSLRNRQLGGALRECLPVFCTTVVAAVYINYDVVVLGQYREMSEVGWYSAVVKTIFGLFIMPLHYFSLALMPVIAEKSEHSMSEARSLWLNNFARTTFVGAVMALGIIVFAYPIVVILFGSAFEPAVQLLIIFAIPGFCYYIYSPMGHWALIRRRQTWSTVITVLATVANIVAVRWLIPGHGMFGATIAAVLTHLVLAIGHIPLTLSGSGFAWSDPGWRIVVRSAVAVGAAWLAAYLLRSSVFAAGLAATLVFTAITWRQLGGLYLDLRVVLQKSFCRVLVP